MQRTPDRAASALEDVVAVEDGAPGMVRVVTWSDRYVVDVRHGRCSCPDMEYHLEGDGRCKHVHAARIATDQTDVPAVWDVADDLSPDPDPLPVETDDDLPDFEDFQVATDGGQVQRTGNRPAGHDQWTVWDEDWQNARHFDKRGAAEDKVAEVERDFDIDVELFPPGESPEALYHADGNPDTDAEPTHETDGGQVEAADDSDDQAGEPVEAEVIDHSPESTEADGHDLPERSVDEDPLDWVPADFVDQIDGTPAINRKGYEVLSHFYDVSVKEPEVMVNPHETDFEYCQVRATAVTDDGRECSALGSAHVDRGDDPELLLEMADTRARKRALSIATGVGAVAVEELKNEVDR